MLLKNHLSIRCHALTTNLCMKAVGDEYLDSYTQ